jgi:hypothetical protein
MGWPWKSLQSSRSGSSTDSTQSLVESEIDFSRTVHFVAEIDLTEIERVREAAVGRSRRYRWTKNARPIGAA